MNASLGFLSTCYYLTESAHLSRSDQEENRNRDVLLPVHVNTFASDFKPISALVVETTWEIWSLVGQTGPCFGWPEDWRPGWWGTRLALS